MLKVYFAGQDNFGNRGCEALIRSSVKTIRSTYPDAEFFVPSRRIDLDSRQWPDAAAHGVRFVPAEPFPSIVRWWGRARRVFKFIEGIVPHFKPSTETMGYIEQADVLIMTGGDIISLDYGLESLYYWAGICKAAMNAGKPTILWAGSVGSFSKSPATERNMREFLAAFSLITVRETPSYDYLNGLGLKGVQQVTDPAFALDYEPAPEEALALFAQTKPVLGLNVSPLILKFRESDEARHALEREVVEFLSEVVAKGEMNVLLIPHVDPLDGSIDNSDWKYMSQILESLRKAGIDADKANILSRSLNAAQLKDVIRRCAYFMGARTHATVAALSQGVPTTSIAYSIKAKGINQDLFGHVRYVLGTPAVSRDSLNEHLALLRHEAVSIRALLTERIPVWTAGAYGSVRELVSILVKGCESGGR